MHIRQRVICAAAVTVVFSSLTFAAYIPPAKRAVIVQNKSWKFIKQNVSGAQAVTFDDASWSTIGLPHSFDIPYWRANTATTPTVGWYRKHITINPALLTTKRIFIEFEAAFLVSQVYVNETLAGTHEGGYTGFSYDITSLLNAGDNVIAVRVNATWNARITPRAGEHIYVGGIYRDVCLVITDPLHVPWYGTFVHSPQVSTTSATVKVSTEIRNDATSAKNCRVVSIVVDSSSNEVTRFESTASVPAGVLDTFVQTSGAISNPHLWTPQTPYMYRVYTEVYDGGTLVDDFSSPLGLRIVRWNKDNGFFLNEQHLWLQGANVHQDHAGWGDATTNSGSVRDVKMIKDCGMNFIRGSHYPHDPAFSDACDKYGLCLWQEMPYWGIGGFVTIDPPPNWNTSAYPFNTADQAPFEANMLQQLREMIRIHRNHPSVIIWSMGNEVFCTSTAVMQQAKNLITAMVAVSHAQDSTRAAGLGGTQRQGFDVLSDVAGYNGDGATLYINPGFPNMVAEYGSCVENRPGNYTACWADLQVSGDSPVQYAWRSGAALWCGFHHGSNVSIGGMGMIDHARLPLRRWYYYRNKFLGIAPPAWPVAGTAARLLLTKDCDTITDDGRSDCHLKVQVQNGAGAWLTNSPAVTLTDRSGLGIFPSTATGSTTITFTAGATERGVLDGMAAIEYRSYNAGTVTIDATSAGLPTSSVTIIVKHVSDSIMTGIVSSIPMLGQSCTENRIFKAVENRLLLPQNMHGKNILASVYDLQGRLIVSKIIKAKKIFDLTGKNYSGKVFLVKVRTLN